MTTKPKVIIPTGLGINSQEELGKAFSNAGAEAEFRHINELIENPGIMDSYQLAGLPGGFMMGDQLGAGQSIRNRTYDSGLRGKLEEKLNDSGFPMYWVCNSLQWLAKLDLFPIKVGTVRNDSGKHETTSWDVEINPKNDTVWLSYIKNLDVPIFAPISHGEGRIIVPQEELKKAEEMNLVALRYVKGHMCEYFKSSRGDRYNPNGSTADIAGFGWNNNIVLFPHFERLLRNFQREDKALIKTGKVRARENYNTPEGFFEPTYHLFKAAVDYVK
jgi:phosphoribosylformylglycinamidine (FGAM) synthase-like amidotransferase family enzyme